MIKLSDFARAQGVTPRAIQKLFKKYKAELEGHFEEKGQNGTWLDDEAQAFLRSKMKQNPITIYDEKALPFYEELKREQAENRELREKLSEVLEKLSASKDAQLQLQAELTEQKLLAAKTADAERRAADAETALTDARERAETAEDIAEINRQEADRAKAEAAELRQQIEKLKTRSLWQRIFNKE